MACVWVHFSLVQLTVLPTSLPKETDRGCVGQVWPSLRLESKSKVQGVINNPHSIERKMNTEFWSSNTTTCNDLISPAPIFFFIITLLSSPTPSRRGMSSSVYLSHTPDWTTHYLTTCHYSTSDWTTSVWTAQTWLVCHYLSMMTFPHRKTVCHNSFLR